MLTKDFDLICRNTPTIAPIFKITSKIPSFWVGLGIEKEDEFAYCRDDSLLHLKTMEKFHVFPSKMKFVEYRQINDLLKKNQIYWP